MPDILRQLDKADLDQVGDVAATVANLAWTHRITDEPEPIDAFAADVNRLCDRAIVFDSTEMLLIKLTRAGVITDEQSFTMHAAHLAQRAQGIPVDDPDMLEMIAERSALEAAAQKSLQQRRASGQVLVYRLDGWMVREHPGGRIERLAPFDQFRPEDFPSLRTQSAHTPVR